MTTIGNFSGYAASQPLRSASPRFGNEAEGPEEIHSAADTPLASESVRAESPASEAQGPSLLEDAQNRANRFLSQQELVQGTRSFVGVLLKGFGLNGALKEANPESTLKERVLAIFNLAAAQFNAAFAGKSEVKSTATQELFQNVLETFPKAILFSSFQKILAPGFEDGALEDLKQRFDIHSDPAEVRDAILDVLTEKPLVEEADTPPAEPAAE